MTSQETVRDYVMLPSISWPPELSRGQLALMREEVRDFQLLHGSIIKRRTPSKSSAHISSTFPTLPTTRPIGASLFPTAFPRSLFHQSLDLQKIWNEVYEAAASDEECLEETLKLVIELDETAKLLWKVHLAAKSAKAARGDVNDELEMGIWRSDYMLHDDSASGGSGLSLKQVEFNTISCAGGVHSNIVSDMHADFTRRGFYDIAAGYSVSNHLYDSMPSNNTVAGIASALRHAHGVYVEASTRNLSSLSSTTGDEINNDPPAPPQAPPYPYCIVMLVQPNSINIADEVPILSAINSPSFPHIPPIPTFRVPFTPAILSSVQLLQSGILLYTPSLAFPSPSQLPSVDPHHQRCMRYEVAVIYHRAGHAMHPPPTEGSASWAFEARLRLESSCAIKCPSVLGHLCTFKSVQTALTRRHTLERLLGLQGDNNEAERREEKIEKLLNACMPMHILNSDAGQEIAHRIISDLEKGDDWVIKPVVGEGGGHNYFGGAVKDLLAGLMRNEERKEERASLMIMRRIVPPRGVMRNYLSLGDGRLWAGDVVSELGVFGGVLYRRTRDGTKTDVGASGGGGCGNGGNGSAESRSKQGAQVEMVMNVVIGWSLKSKMPDVNEMSVIKGYGVFDSPLLVNDELFAEQANAA